MLWVECGAIYGWSVVLYMGGVWCSGWSVMQWVECDVSSNAILASAIKSG